MKTVWTALLWLAVTLAVAWLPATAQGANALSGDVLVLDFTGLNDTDARKHARRFAEPLLPDARLYTFGFSGKVPDAQRANEGHNLILRHETEAERLAAARSVVNGFTSGQQTVLAFDINESLIPNQIWGLVPGMADHKVREPALIAAQIAEAWKRQHPNGTLILRGHSDGTEVVRLVVDKLVAQGITPQMVMAESPRATYDQWLLRAAKLADTLFVFINADKDWPRANLVDQGFAKPGLPNMIDYNIKGDRKSVV